MFALIVKAPLFAKAAAGYVRARLGSERGQDLIEYALMGGILAAGIAIMATILVVGNGTSAFDDMANAIASCLDFEGACPE
jgi:Flp pilus assembly pilin Flp